MKWKEFKVPFDKDFYENNRDFYEKQKKERDEYCKKAISADLQYLMDKYYSDYICDIKIVQLKENSKFYVVLEQFLRPKIEKHISNSYSYGLNIGIATLFKADTLEDLFLQVTECNLLGLPPKPIDCPELTDTYAKIFQYGIKNLQEKLKVSRSDFYGSYSVG